MPELEELLKQIRRKYSVEVVPLKLGGKELKVLQFTDFESYLEELIESQQVGPRTCLTGPGCGNRVFFSPISSANSPLYPGSGCSRSGPAWGWSAHMRLFAATR